MSVEANKNLVNRFWDELWNKGIPSSFDDILPPHYAAAERGNVAIWRTAFPDFLITVDELLAEGNRVAARVTFRGTHLGEFNAYDLVMESLPPTGKAVEICGVWIFDVVDGKKLRDYAWGVGDWLSLLRQLGVMPAPRREQEPSAPA